MDNIFGNLQLVLVQLTVNPQQQFCLMQFSSQVNNVK